MFHLSADVRVVHQAGLDLGEAYRTEEHLWILSLTFGDRLEVGLGIGVGFTFDTVLEKGGFLIRESPGGGVTRLSCNRGCTIA